MDYFDYDSEKYKEFMIKVNDRYYDGENFEKTVESIFGFSDVPNEVKSMVHWLAWERSHSDGYGEVLNQYHGLVNLIGAVYECEK